MKAEVVVQPVPVTLEDLFTGFNKKLKVTKKVHGANGRVTSVAKVHEIKGKAGERWRLSVVVVWWLSVAVVW
jgi:hypothetical protein